MPSSSLSPMSPLDQAIRRLVHLLSVAGVVLVLGEGIVALVLHMPALSACLAVATTLLVLVAEWFFLARASRDSSRVVAWVLGSYAVKVGILILSLYVPRALGVDIRFPAIAAILAILVASFSQVFVLSSMRQMTVDQSFLSGDSSSH
ncbi:hypothetical protein [Schaalia sp. ZJ405]|uniref:hypothetical protein n=1 Tax=Schaalia sp. ZJ405 TaxID=2709403 RepID=UPI001E5A234E|nr:hypothetical protein [Schaalia sp. ZJ405]